MDRLGSSSHNQQSHNPNPDPNHPNNNNNLSRLCIGKVLPVWLAVLRLTRIKKSSSNPKIRSRSLSSRSSLHSHPAIAYRRDKDSDDSMASSSSHSINLNPFRAMRCGSLKTESSRFEFDDRDSVINQRDDPLFKSVSRSNPAAVTEKLCVSNNLLNSKLNDPGSHVNLRNSKFNQDRISTDSTLITDSDANCPTNYSSTFDSTIGASSEDEFYESDGDSNVMGSSDGSDGVNHRAKGRWASDFCGENKGKGGANRDYVANDVANDDYSRRCCRGNGGDGDGGKSRDLGDGDGGKKSRDLGDGDGEMIGAEAEEMESEDPFRDFVSSICEMMVSYGLRRSQEVEALFLHFLRLNHPCHHRTIAISFLHVLHHLHLRHSHRHRHRHSHNLDPEQDRHRHRHNLDPEQDRHSHRHRHSHYLDQH